MTTRKDKAAAGMEAILPQWTKRVVTSMTGRDPLGLSRVSNIITDYLLTGIITTTNRARYYSFYPWAIWYTNLDNPKRYEDFVTGFRRREAAMALATLMHDPETSPVGVLATRDVLEKAEGRDTINCDFRVLPSNATGGYGQYYQGSLHALGLTAVTEGGVVQVTESLGAEIAQLHHETIAATSYVSGSLSGKGRVDTAKLRESASHMTLDALGEPFARREREWLIDMFFGRSATTPTERTTLRRQSLALVMDTIRQYEVAGAPLEVGANLEYSLLCVPHYHGFLEHDELEPVPYSCPKVLARCQLLWRQFCLHHYLTQAIEGLLCGILEIIGGENQGLTADQTVGRIMEQGFVEALAELTAKECHSPRESLRALGVDGVPGEVVTARSWQRFRSGLPLCETELTEWDDSLTAELIARSCLLLGVLYAKWRANPDPTLRDLQQQITGVDLWAGNTLGLLDRWQGNDLTWNQALLELIEGLIVPHHDRIMYEKGRLDSCWLHKVEGRIVKDQDYEPAWRSSRFGNVVSILRDLGILAVEDDRFVLTSEGCSILAEVVGER